MTSLLKQVWFFQTLPVPVCEIRKDEEPATSYIILLGIFLCEH